MISESVLCVPVGARAALFTTTRLGGVSRPPFESLNVSFRSTDDAEAVEENRRRIAEACGIRQMSITTAIQVHGAQVIRVDGPFNGSREADGILTLADEVVPAVLTADCFPVALAAEDPPVRVIVHAGWRGVLAGVIGVAVAAAAEVGAGPDRLAVAIGPGIDVCCYRIGREVLAEMERRGTDPERFVQLRDGETHFDLRELIYFRLLEAGVAPGAIRSLPLCTACREDLFFSHRRDRGNTGRMMSLLVSRNGTAAPPGGAS